MKFFFTILLLFIVFQSYINVFVNASTMMKNVKTFGVTNKLYNGTVSYDGLFKACKELHAWYVPCTQSLLLEEKFWNYKISGSWILNSRVNCVGYTTDSDYTLGSCVDTNLGNQATVCTCEMNIPICCVLKK